MQPVVHPVVGYLCYAGYTRLSRSEPPERYPAVVTVVAASLADLIDKPLAFLGVVPVGRTVGHSLLFALPAIAAVGILAGRYDRPELGVAFALGYVSHLVADVPWHLLSGDYHELGFLLWPVTPMPEYTGTKPIGWIAGVEVTTLWIEAAILIAGVAVWVYDDAPGTGVVRRAIRRE